MKQYVNCKFELGYNKYAYLWEGPEPLEVNDFVIVESPKDGAVFVKVIEVNITPPEGVHIKKIIERVVLLPDDIIG